MKKLLVLLMVLGMASMANATLQISVNGDMNPVDSMIEIAPSDHLVLDIWTNAEIVYQTGTYYVLATDTALAHIANTSGVIVGTESGLSILWEMSPVADLGWGAGVIPAGVDGIGGGAFDMDLGNTLAGTVLFDLFDFHCLAPGDTTIYLFESPNAETDWTLSDTVVIHQIPEPMTMALLGLGGLFLRRRK